MATLAAAKVPLLMLLAFVVSVVALAEKPASVAVWFIHLLLELSYANISLSAGVPVIVVSFNSDIVSSVATWVST